MIVLYSIARNKSAGSTQPSFAVHRHCSCFILDYFHEIVHYLQWRAGAISKIQLIVVDTLLLKVISVVGLVIQSNDCAYM